jgi:microcystin-dependent protein
VANGGTGVTSSTGTGSTVLSASPTFTGTPLAPTASVTTDNTQIATTAFVRDIIPAGIISMWSGSIVSIPTGWVLCDGTNSTPDLRNRFVVGAGSTYAVNATGGSANATLPSHNHTAVSNVTDPTHNHQTNGYADNTGSGVGFLRTSQGGDFSLINTTAVATGITVATTINSSGTSATNANLPPYFALAYIMKT